MSAASTPAQTRVSEAWPVPDPDPCPECGQPYSRAHPRQIFCCPAHKRKWEGRLRKRGFQFLPFAWASRQTRGGSRGKVLTGTRATADGDMLLQRWRDEDQAKGRMSMVDYLDLRYRLGFDRP